MWFSVTNKIKPFEEKFFFFYWILHFDQGWKNKYLVCYWFQKLFCLEGLCSIFKKGRFQILTFVYVSSNFILANDKITIFTPRIFSVYLSTAFLLLLHKYFFCARFFVFFCHVGTKTIFSPLDRFIYWYGGKSANGSCWEIV